METHFLTFDDIPEFLKDSELCKNIESSNEPFDVPIKFFKKEIIIITFEDLIDYIKILDYWMIINTPDEIYDWVFKNKRDIDINLLNETFPMNNIVKQIISIIKTINNVCCVTACHGYLDLLKYGCKIGTPFVEDIYINAVHNGHLECLKYAYEKSGSWFKGDVCITAANEGHLECLKYAHENGCPLPENTCYYAARKGSLECLKYAHEKLYIFFKKYIILLFK